MTIKNPDKMAKWIGGCLHRAVLICALAFVGGCAMQGLKGDLKAMDRLQEISGKVVCDDPIDAPVVVVLWALDEADVSGYWLTQCEGDFIFLRESGRYYLLSFADANKDGRYQTTEYRAVFGDGKVLDLESGDTFHEMELKLLPPGEVEFPAEVMGLTDDEVAEKFALREGQVGELTTLDNPLFSDANGATGLWTPLRFFDQIGVKIYFLEPYDPDKVPVLFVHGAGGHPGTWKPIIENLDHDTYQSWLAFYPSGLHLDELSEIYTQHLADLHLTYGCKQLYVVAHSMGGLISRSMMQSHVKLNSRIELPLFITLASPWGGHTGARAGVMYAPAVVPSWYDMVPESPFQKELASLAMPPETLHYLFFAYRGKASIAPGHVNNDGVVTLESQLSMPIQQQAQTVTGINADHVSILSDENTLLLLNQILDNTEAGDVDP